MTFWLKFAIFLLYGFACFMAGRQEGKNEIMKFINDSYKKRSQNDNTRTN